MTPWGCEHNFVGGCNECFNVMIERVRAKAVQAEREAWLAACREVAGWYPEGVFDPDGQTLDAKSAAIARLTVKNVQETRTRTAQDEGE